MKTTNCSPHALTAEGEPLTSGKIPAASNLTSGTEDVSSEEGINDGRQDAAPLGERVRALGRREEHRERDLADEVEEPLFKAFFKE